jgi:hypothetical protein
MAALGFGHPEDDILSNFGRNSTALKREEIYNLNRKGTRCRRRPDQKHDGSQAPQSAERVTNGCAGVRKIGWSL